MKQFYNKYNYWFKWIFSISLLIYIFYKIDINSFLKSFSLVPWWYFPLAITLKFILQLLATYRWNLLLPEHSFIELLRLNLISQYYMFLLPSSITADVAKITQADSKNKGKSHIASGLLIDRIIGFMILVILIIYSLLNINHYQLNIFLPFLLVIFICLFLGFILLYTSLSMKIIHLIEKLNFHKKFYVKQFLNGIKVLLNGIQTYIKQPKLLLKLFVLAFFFQFFLACTYLISDFIFEFNLSVWNYIVVSGLTQIMTLMPLGIAGIGIKDLSFITIMFYFGINNEKSMASVLVGYPIMLFFVFIGWIISLKKTVKKNS